MSQTENGDLQYFEKKCDDLESSNEQNKPNEEKEIGNLRGEEDEADCGCYSFTPKWLQYFNNPAGYLFVFGMFLTIQGLLVNGYMNVIISTLERRFGLQSSETGLIVVSYDISYFVFCLFITFYGNRAHKPRLLGIGSIFLGVGCFIFSVPHFTTGQYKYQANVSDLCSLEAVSQPDTVDDENLDAYLFLFIFAMVIQGIGCIPLYTVGFAVLEDSLTKGKSAIYLGIANALTILGPVLGYVLGGYLLSVYVDFDTTKPDEIDLDTSDPRWVGAWWVGFLIAGTMCLTLVSVPMLSFPKQFPGSAKVRAMKESEVHAKSGEEITEQDDFGKSIRDMPAAIYHMVRNMCFLFTTLAGCSEGFIIAAFTAFLPKFIENQFNLSATAAALYTGVIAIPGGVFGNIISALLIQRLKLKTAGVLKMCILCAATVFCMAPATLLRCNDPLIAGVNKPYSDSPNFTGPANLTSLCNSNCNCQERYFSPVCGADDISYFSACIAGCSVQNSVNSSDVFTECQCIHQEDQSGNNAVEGLCETPCNVLAPFLTIFFFIVLINFMTTTPALLIIMRCVPSSQKSFAIGVQWWIVRFFGSIPGPIVFGLIFDATCILWQTLPDENTGSCWLHDSKYVSIYLLIASLACKAVSVIFFSLALYFYEPPSQLTGDAKEQKIGHSDFDVGDVKLEINSTKL